MTPVTVRVHYDALRLLAGKALAGGGRLIRTEVQWDISGDCLAPVVREIYSRPSERGKRDIVVRIGHHRGIRSVLLTCKCRKCKNCLARRGRHWTHRAKAEFQLAATSRGRTWFGSLTMDPEIVQRHENLARRHARSQGDDFDLLSSDEKFKRVSVLLGREATLFVKRMRKGNKEKGYVPASFRYLLVTEAHKSGVPHLHMFVHETAGACPVLYKHLKDEWKLGFSSWKLKDPDFASYPCKYLNKSSLARVRASGDYGRRQPLVSDVLALHGVSRATLVQSLNSRLPLACEPRPTEARVLFKENQNDFPKRSPTDEV